MRSGPARTPQQGSVPVHIGGRSGGPASASAALGRVPKATVQALQQTSGNAAVGRILSGGQPLEPDVRAEMEQRFGEDFSAVRVHTGPAAGRATDALDAEAFTHGRDVAFGPQRYAPRTGTGRALLAHELAHVIQQSRGGTRPAESSSLESGADRAAGAAVAGTAPVAVTGASAVGVARKKKRQKQQTPKKVSELAGPSIPNEPKLNDLWPYDKEVGPNRKKLGQNVQREHPIPVAVRKEQRTAPDGTQHHNRKVSAALGQPTILLETGKATATAPDKPHTQIKRTQMQVLKDVRAGKLKSEGELVARIQEGYKEVNKSLRAQGKPEIPQSTINMAILADQATIHRTTQETAKELSKFGTTKELAKDIDKAIADLDQAFPKADKAAAKAAGKPSKQGKALSKKFKPAGGAARPARTTTTTKAVAPKTPAATGPLSAAMKASSKKSRPGGVKGAATKTPETPAATATPPKAAPKPVRAKPKRAPGAPRKGGKKTSTKARNPKARNKPSPKAKGKIRVKAKAKVPRMKMRGRGGKYVGAGVALLGLLATAAPAFASTKPSEPTAAGAPPTNATGPERAAAAPVGPGSAPDPAALADAAETLDTEVGPDAADVSTDGTAPDDAAADAADSAGGEPDVDQAPGAPGAEAPPSKLSMAGDIMSATGVLATSLPLKGKAAKVGGGAGAALQLAGLAAKLKDMHAKGASKTEMAEAAWGTAAQGAAAHVIPTGPLGMAVNMGNAGAQALGAPQGMQDSLSIASDLVPANMAAQSIGATGPMLAHAATGNWKEFDRGADNIMAGQAGPALQGYFAVVTLGVDALSGKDMWKSLNEVTAKGKGSVADRVGSYLGDETYKFINRDLPEAAEFASKDIARLKKRMSDAKSAVTQRASAMVDAAKGAAEGTIAPVKEKTTAIVNTVKRGVEQKVDAVTQSVAHKVQASEKKIDEVKKAASERIEDVKTTIADTVDAAASKSASVKEGVKEGIADARTAITEKAAPIRNKITALLDKPWF